MQTLDQFTRISPSLPFLLSSTTNKWCSVVKQGVTVRKVRKEREVRQLISLRPNRHKYPSSDSQPLSTRTYHAPASTASFASTLSWPTTVARTARQLASSRPLSTARIWSASAVSATTARTSCCTSSVTANVNCRPSTTLAARVAVWRLDKARQTAQLCHQVAALAAGALAQLPTPVSSHWSVETGSGLICPTDTACTMRCIITTPVSTGTCFILLLRFMQPHPAHQPSHRPPHQPQLALANHRTV